MAIITAASEDRPSDVDDSNNYNVIGKTNSFVKVENGNHNNQMVKQNKYEGV